jgi:hypothetical protein
VQGEESLTERVGGPVALLQDLRHALIASRVARIPLWKPRLSLPII